MAVSAKTWEKMKRWVYACLFVLLILFLLSLFYFVMGVWMLAIGSDTITSTSVT